MKNSVKLTVLTLISLSAVIPQDVRNIRDDVGYCWSIPDMEKLVKCIEENTTSIDEYHYIAGISPHDDYLYAGRIYYPLFRNIKSKEVVIFGVTHGTVRREIGDPQNVLIFDSFTMWQGLSTPVAVSDLREYIINKLDTAYYRINNKAHMLEHSIEGMVPFLQYFNPDVRITPIMVTAMSFSRMEEISSALSKVISGYIEENKLRLGCDIFFLISSDANHYGADFNNIPFGEDSTAHVRATGQDRRIANDYIAGSVEPERVRKLTEELKNVVWCGKFSIPVGLLTAEKIVENRTGKKLSGKVISYSDTFTEGVLPVKGTKMGTTAPFSFKHWCGFFSAGFWVDAKSDF